MKKILLIITGFCVLLSCTDNTRTSQKSDTSIDSVKNLILSKEYATLERWYNGDPMGFVDNSWENITYFDPSLTSRLDSIDAFRELLTPIIGKVHVPYHRFDKPMVQVYGDIAILSFTDVFALNDDSARWHATEIYQCRNNEWKLIHSHWTESKIK